MIVAVPVVLTVKPVVAVFREVMLPPAVELSKIEVVPIKVPGLVDEIFPVAVLSVTTPPCTLLV